MSHKAQPFAQVAQSVEQRTENPRVTGSIPVLGTFAGTEILKKSFSSFCVLYFLFLSFSTKLIQC